MPLDWFNTPLDADIGDLIARKKRSKAIELLRSELQGRMVPPVPMRLQLADLLVQAGREAEAMPVLIGLADEFAGDGFVAKAVAILKRVDRIQPGRHDVESRLARLVKLQQAAPVPKSSPRQVPEFDEEAEAATATLADELASPLEPPVTAGAPLPRAVADTETTQRVRGVFRRFLASLPGGGSSAGAPPAGPSPGETAQASDETLPDAAGVEAIPDNVPDTVADVETIDASDAMVAEPEAGPAEAAAPPPAAPASGPDAHGVAGRLRGAFRWLVASLASPETPPAPVTEAAPAEASPGPVVEAAAVPESPVAAPETPVASLEATPRQGTDAPDAGGDGEPMSDEMFQERLLDLVQDILRRPGSRTPPLDGAPLDRRLVLRYAQRLLATALFGDLSEDELLAVVRGLRLHLRGPGDVLITEGERGQSVFVLASGTAKVFVRSPSGRNFPVAELREGDFFGEISSLSGRPRSATVTSSARCELLELDRPTLDAIARTHPRVADVLEDFYIRRASSPEASAVRAVSLSDADTERKAIEVLEAHFGQSRWDPRMRLRLADVLLKAGKYQDAVPILIGLADDLARGGYPEKAIAVLKKIERIQRRNIEVVNLAPLSRGAPPAVAPPPAPRPAPREGTAARPAWGPRATAEFFEGWLLDVLRDRVGRGDARDCRTEAERAALASVRGYGPGLLASPLFEDFSDEELLAVIRGLRLLTFEAGDIIITEGEPGQSLFVLTTGTVKVFVRDPSGRNVALCPLGEGAFFGEIATLSARPRSATVTAASRCELLELDKPALDAILKVHPRVREVLEEHYIARANDPEAAAIRGTALGEPTPDGAA